MERPRTALARPCPVCAHGDGYVLGELTFAPFDNFPIASRFAIAACSGCGLVLGNTPSRQADYNRYYRGQNYSPTYLERTPKPAERDYLDESVAILSGIVDTRQAAILDIGCGMGFFLEHLRAAGYDNITGLDSSPECVARLTTLKNIPAHTGTLTDALPIRPDVMTLFHVWEHVVEVSAALDHLIAQMPADCKILLEVPDSQRLADCTPGQPLSYFYITHLLHLDQRHLQNMFTSRGLRCLGSGRRLRREEGLDMPCIWAVFQKEGRRVIKPDFSLAYTIADWFDQTGLDPSGDLLSLQCSKKPVYVWGLGIHAQMYLGMSPLKNCNIRALLDRNPDLIGRSMGGWRVASSDVLSTLGTDDAVVVTTRVHQNNMRAHLADMGFSGQVVTI